MNVKKPILLASAIGLFGTVTFTAHATDSIETRQVDAPAFEELDTNQNGIVSEEEARGTWLESAFARVDANGDGYVSKTEYEEATG